MGNPLPHFGENVCVLPPADTHMGREKPLFTLVITKHQENNAKHGKKEIGFLDGCFARIARVKNTIPHLYLALEGIFLFPLKAVQKSYKCVADSLALLLRKGTVLVGYGMVLPDI